MPHDTESFFDPKTSLAVFAAILSVVTFIWNLYNQFEQNRRWNKLNAGNIEITKPVFQVFRKWPRATFSKIDFGYQTKIYSSADNPDVLDQVNFLRVRDKRTTAILDFIDTCNLVSEVADELKRKGYASPVEITKVYRPTFYLKNEGKTEVRDFVLVAYVFTPDSQWLEIHKAVSPQAIVAGFEMNIPIEWELPLDAPLPQRLPFKLSVSYTDVNGNKITKDLQRVWQSTTNHWTLN